MNKTNLNHTPSVNKHEWNQADRTFHQLLTIVLQRLVVYMKTNKPGVNSIAFLTAATNNKPTATEVAFRWLKYTQDLQVAMASAST